VISDNALVRARFHLPETDASGHGLLTGDEAGHLTRVLRLGVGAEIDVFDGRGGMFHARVVDVGRPGVRVAVLSAMSPAPEPAIRVTLVMSILKGDKMDAVVRDATMMGVSAVQPIVASRSEISLAAVTRAQRVERWRRIAVASVKQCGRAVVPVVETAVDLRTWMAHRSDDAVLALTEPAGGEGAPLAQVPRCERVHLLVGPEGGWTADETAVFATAGFRAIALGGRTLRADAAPLVAMAAVFEAWGGW
jgi:16S rRNA (uracil1498-N3)-methyltransferase